MATSTLQPEQMQASQRGGVPPWLFVVFFLSGISGLMYQVVWVRMLSRILGNTVYATSTVLAAFMAGLALGSYLMSRRADHAGRPILWYALLELGIGVSALLSLVLPELLVPVYQGIYQATGENRIGLTVGQVAVALAVLLLPTAMMGATLPTLSAFGARRHSSFGGVVGALYALNTLGAVVGVLASGFALIGMVGETSTLLLGGAINAVVAAVALASGFREPMTAVESVGAVTAATPAAEEAISTYPLWSRRVVAVSFGLNGLVALALEVVWSRLLPFYLGNSIYGFSAMLAVMLAAMVLGSWWGSRIVDRVADPLRLLGGLQIGTGLGAIAGLWVFQWPAFDENWPSIFYKLVGVPLILVGPFGLLSGMSFPIAARCYAPSRGEGGKSVGRLYAWNTLGCIAGALLAGFVFIPRAGASFTALTLAGLNLLLGFSLFLVHPQGFASVIRTAHVVMVGIAALLAFLSGDVLGKILQRRVDLAAGSNYKIMRHIEEADATVTVLGDGIPNSHHRLLWINGIGMTALTPVTKLMAHLPLALADNPKDALVICFGMGTTFKSASTHPGLNVTVVELVGGVLQCFDDFHPGGSALFKKPNLKAVVDDGRNYLLMHPQQYDVITVDPAPPLDSAGTVNLYCREFFSLCKSRLRPGGVMCLWVPPAARTEVKMILRTFADVFPHVNVWRGAEYAGFYVVGTLKPLEDVPDKLARLFKIPEAVADLNAWGDLYDRPAKISALYVCDETKLLPFLATTPVITDDHPYTEFTLWRSMFDPEYQVDYATGQGFDAYRLTEALEQFQRK